MSFRHIWVDNDLLYVTVTGMELTETAIRLKVGQLPTVDFTMCINSFLDKLSIEELDKMKELITKAQLNELHIKEPKEVLIQIGRKKPKGTGVFVIPP